MKYLFLIIIAVKLYSFEVNTHQAITKCAIENNGSNNNECNKQGASNLHKFTSNMRLNNINYKYEQFEKYNETYFDYARKKDDFKNWNIDFSLNRNYKDLIEAGSILEDSEYHNANVGAYGLTSDAFFDDDADGRFNNHFYSVQKETSPSNLSLWLAPISTTTSSNGVGSRFVSSGLGSRVDNITWVFDKQVVLRHPTETNRVNDYGLDDTFKYFTNSFEGNASSRKTNQAKLFVSLGFITHMLQDLHSPAHVRDNVHPKGDYLEIFNRFKGGFRLNRGKFDDSIRDDIFQAVRDINTSIMLGGYRGNNNLSYEDFFQKEAKWVSYNFFSEAHNDRTGNGHDSSTLEYDTWSDSDTIFDFHNNTPKEGAHTDTKNIPDSVDRFCGVWIFGKTIWPWDYIKSRGDTTSEKRDFGQNNVLAIVEDGCLWDSERMMAVVDTPGYWHRKIYEKFSYDRFDKTPLLHTSINTIPRAVVSTEAFINFFFRGQMEASLLDDENILIKNTSDSSLVSSDDVLKFKADSKLKIFAIDSNGNSKMILTRILNKDINVSSNYTININGHIPSLIKEKFSVGDVIEGMYFMIDGKIGEDIGEYDNFDINNRGIYNKYII